MGGLDTQAAMQADARFEAMLNGFFDPVAGCRRFWLGQAVSRPVRNRITRRRRSPYLAIAENHRARPAIYSLDKILLKAGEILRSCR